MFKVPSDICTAKYNVNNSNRTFKLAGVGSLRLTLRAYQPLRLRCTARKIIKAGIEFGRDGRSLYCYGGIALMILAPPKRIKW